MQRLAWATAISVATAGLASCSGSGSEGSAGGAPSGGQFIAGGLLATVVGPDGAVTARRLDRGVDFPALDPGFADWMDGGLFGATWEGGLWVETAGAHVLGAAAGDSIRVHIDGEMVLEAWETDDYAELSTELNLGRGWHALRVEFERDPERALAVLSLAGPGEARRVVDSERLGYAASPPTGWGDFDFETLEVEGLYAYGATLRVRTTLPARIEVERDGELLADLSDGEAAPWSDEHVVAFELEPGVPATLDVRAVDPWDRTLQSKTLTVTPPAEDDFEFGGLLGTYYTNKDLTGALGQRLDPQIQLPADADGNEKGSFGMPTEPDDFSIRWTGAVWAEETGDYTFYVGSDDGQRLRVDGALVIDDWTNHGFEYRSAPLALTKGWHGLTLEYFEAGGQARVQFEWEGPGFGRELVGAESLGHALPEGLGAPTIQDVATSVEWSTDDEGTSLATVRLDWLTNSLASSQVDWGVGALDSQEIAGAPATAFSLKFGGLPAGETFVYRLVGTSVAGPEGQAYDGELFLEPPPEEESEGEGEADGEGE